MKKQRDIKMYIIWGSLLIYLLILHRFVGIYFDDFGYFTLSYPRYIESISGNQWGGVELLKFLKIHYNEWGGRIFYFGIELLLYKIGGLNLLRISQAFIIAGILYTIYKIINSQINRPLLTSIIICCLYGFFTTVGESLYWFSASVSYVWPMLPFFIVIYKTYFKEELLLKDHITICFCTFIASWSQEQIGFTVLIYIVILMIKNFMEKHKINIYSIIYFVSSVAGFLCLYLAPGNFVRKGGDAFYSQSLIKILQISISNLLYGFFSEYNWLLLILLFAMSSYIAFSIAKKLSKTLLDRNIHFIISIILGFIAIIIFYTKGEFFTFIYHKCPFSIYFIFIILVQMIYLHARYFFYTKNAMILFLCIMILIPCLYSSYWVDRMNVPFVFLYFLISGTIFIEVLSKKTKEYYSIFIVLLICASINSFMTLVGYGKEYIYVISGNEELLQKASKEEYQNCTIRLKACIDDRYTGLMPWVLGEGAGKDFVEEEMRRYYGIDSSVLFEWYR